ncbi:MAG: BglII/BstYI family type II restriction endonuclease [Armatimonadetes bacterium]|nr:BglII/BstYI family type II restriction endonuclease [Armatimonadota bacterium]
MFRHVVGKSTSKEGFAVPRDCEEWMCAPVKGCKREISLMFDKQTIPATLRRIDNEQGSVQVKYEKRDGEPFRIWLATTFAASPAISTGDFFEVRRVEADVFQILPFAATDNAKPSLQIEQWLFHRGTDRLIEQDTPLAEIPAVVHAVPFAAQEGQSFYNRAFSHSFASWSWQSECRVMQELGLKCDFAKDGVQVEVEFGNARTYYQDFVKFLLGNHYCGVSLGVLVVPSVSFAKHLCEVGRQRAVEKGRTQYSGMIDFDKVHREFHYLEFMLPMPIAIASVGSTTL